MQATIDFTKLPQQQETPQTIRIQEPMNGMPFVPSSEEAAPF